MMKWIKWFSQCVSNLSTCIFSLKKIQGNNGIWTHDLRDTCVLLYQLSYEA